MNIDIVPTVDTRLPRSISFSNLFAYLQKHFNIEARLGTTCYEYFNSENWVKPMIDYEVLVDRFEPDTVDNHHKNLLDSLNELLHTDDEEWAIARDCRFVQGTRKNASTGKKEACTQFKISFHLVLWTRKCMLCDFGKFLKAQHKFIAERHLDGIDMAIYRAGINKWRIPFTKKTSDNIESLMVPKNFNDEDTFHRHIVQLTQGCDELRLKLPSIEMNHEEQAVQQCIDQMNQKTENDIQRIIDQYTVVTKCTKIENGMEIDFYDVKEQECNGDHKNNHNYLIHNKTTNTLRIKCHSLKCRGFERILKKAQYQSKHFNISFLNNLPLRPDESDNYLRVKQYFESYFVFVRDGNSFYRICYEYNNKHDYLEKQVKPITIAGYASDMFFKEWPNDEEKKEDDQMKLKPFFKRYLVDPHKISYLGLSFQPFGVFENARRLSNGDYNLFDGFNYQTVLDNQLPSDCDHLDLCFLIEHIKMHVCGCNRYKNSPSELNLARHSFNYLMKLIANIIQQPTKLPEIITVFYSRTHGTGKSGLLKFISNVVGQYLTCFGTYEQIVEKHTNAHVGKLINIIEESNSTLSRKYHNTMKNLSQQESAIYNEKNQKQTSIKTHVRYFITTNYDDGVFFDCEDRRHVVYTFMKVNDREYIDRLNQVLASKAVMHLFGRFLEQIEIDYKKTDWLAARPLTDDYHTMMQDNPIVIFLREFMMMESLSFDCIAENEYFQTMKEDAGCAYNFLSITKDGLYRLYSRFFDDNACTYKKNKSKLVFLKYVKQNYGHCYTVHRYPQRSRHIYFTIDMRRIWSMLFNDEPFVNHHFGGHEQDNDITRFLVDPMVPDDDDPTRWYVSGEVTTADQTILDKLSELIP